MTQPADQYRKVPPAPHSGVTAGQSAPGPSATGEAGLTASAAGVEGQLEAMPAAVQQPPAAAAGAVPEPTPELWGRAAAVRRAAMALGQLADGERRAALRAMASALRQEEQTILAANRADLEAAAAAI